MKKLVILIIILTLYGCSTPYQKHGLSGGYSEKKITPIEYAIQFSGNGYSSCEKVADMTLLRASELALNSGFNYFIIIKSSVNVDSSTRMNLANYVSTGMGSGVSFGQSVAIPKPSANIQVMFFVEKPWTAQEVYDVKGVIEHCKEKYKITNDFQQGSLDTREIKNFYRKMTLKNQGNCDVQGKSDDIIIVNSDSLKSPVIPISGLLLIDNYFSNSEEYSFYSALSKELGADTVWFSQDKNFNRDVGQKQSAELFSKVIPKKIVTFGRRLPVVIGITLQTSLLKDNIFEIRSFSECHNKKLSGLKIGDRLISINGVDFSNRNKILLEMKPHDTVGLKVTRGGDEIFLKVPLYAPEWE